MTSRLRKHLDDAQAAIGLALKFLGERTLDDYRSDEFLRSAVERQVEIVGEASRRVLSDVPDLAQQMPDLVRAISLRNRLAHGYDGIDHAIVYSVVRFDFPEMRANLERAVAGLEGG